MISQTEQYLSRSLRAVLARASDGGTIEHSDELQEVLFGLEFFVPGVLQELHSEWKHESLDGICPLVVRKTAAEEIEIFGQCILLSDQTLTLIHVRLQVDPSRDELSWLECRLGERGEQGLVRTPCSSPTKGLKRLWAVEGKVDQIEWVYKVTFGQRRVS